MGFDLPVFFSAGLKDSLGAVSLAWAGLLALALLSLRQAGRGAAPGFVLVFALVLVFNGVVADFKVLDPFITRTQFFQWVMWFFLGLGFFFLFLGVIFLREWGLLRMGVERQFASPIPMVACGRIPAMFAAFFIASVSGIVANVWPVNYQIVYQGEVAFSRGSLFHSLGGLFIYEFFRHAGVLLVAGIFFMAQRPGNLAFLQKKKSLITIITSAAYFALGMALVFFFYIAVTKPWF